jgi:hypothetical protein
LAHGKINDEDRSRAFLNATYAGNKNIVELLLNNGPILKQKRDQSLQRAQSKGDDAIAYLLETKLQLASF